MRIWHCRFCRQSRELLVVGLNIFLWIVLSLLFSRALYFVMVVLQLSAVCLVMILWASVLAFFPILVSFSIHVCNYVGIVGKGGILSIWISCNVLMARSL